MRRSIIRRASMPLDPAVNSAEVMKDGGLNGIQEPSTERDYSVPPSPDQRIDMDQAMTQDDSRVVLRIYNIDKYGLSRLGSKALNKEVNAIWHVAIGAFGSEIWFDHQINEESLDGIEVRFGYQPVEVIDLGETDKTIEELREYLVELKQKYNVETYDCFYHNCHNFADEIARWLTGSSIPQWCLDHGGDALSNIPLKDAKTIQWASNKIAKIMMVSWGRYNKERFERKFGGNTEN
eukprot:CAMPEP_0167752518 /NCGR_PEP_ID=MMETSP0110_2-20121227/7185_1 /TAXON_ID=629695 /ORGANISM="Gymnochlora sp., Strain CCMP2014" /LENGTH=235 /DNA_ID=CAMNT_0007638147 /DNA_START=165 /DNA_END=872 /DNA_ORIENTATION=-